VQSVITRISRPAQVLGEVKHFLEFIKKPALLAIEACDALQFLILAPIESTLVSGSMSSIAIILTEQLRNYSRWLGSHQIPEPRMMQACKP
jgi:hypothetical protein